MTSIEMGKDLGRLEIASARETGAEHLSHTAIAYGIGASVAVLFNTLLAWVKDSFEPLNTAMAKLTGHHWTTHGLAVVLVFLLVGFALSRKDGDALKGAYAPVVVLCGSVVLAGLGLVAWFVFN
jgi:hypothetical protein